MKHRFVYVLIVVLTGFTTRPGLGQETQAGLPAVLLGEPAIQRHFLSS